VPWVENGCWGGCIEPALCWALDDCRACNAINSICIELPLPFDHYYVCSTREASCDPVTCDCLPDDVCGGDLVCQHVTGKIVSCGDDGSAEGDGAAGTTAWMPDASAPMAR
jgi:hypothetical protein